MNKVLPCSRKKYGVSNIVAMHSQWYTFLLKKQLFELCPFDPKVSLQCFLLCLQLCQLLIDCQTLILICTTEI